MNDNNPEIIKIKRLQTIFDVFDKGDMDSLIDGINRKIFNKEEIEFIFNLNLAYKNPPRSEFIFNRFSSNLDIEIIELQDLYKKIESIYRMININYTDFYKFYDKPINKIEKELSWNDESTTTKNISEDIMETVIEEDLEDLDLDMEDIIEDIVEDLAESSPLIESKYDEVITCANYFIPTGEDTGFPIYMTNNPQIASKFNNKLNRIDRFWLIPSGKPVRNSILFKQLSDNMKVKKEKVDISLRDCYLNTGVNIKNERDRRTYLMFHHLLNGEIFKTP